MAILLVGVQHATLDSGHPNRHKTGAMSHQALDPLTFGAEQKCFGCGPDNDRGWRLRFAREDDAVSTRLVPSAGEEGPPGIFHGGLQATLADEIAGWTLVGLRDRMGFTTSMQIRYMRPMRIDREITARGRIASESEGSVTVKVTLEQEGKIGCRATVSYSVPDAKSAAKTLGRELPDEWRRFVR